MKAGYQDSPPKQKALYGLPTEEELRNGRNGFKWGSTPERYTEFEEPIRGDGWIKYPIRSHRELNKEIDHAKRT